MTIIRALTLTATFGILAVLLALNLSRAPVQAAGDSELSDACEAVAQAGAIIYYYCEPDIGPHFLANNMGFIARDD